MQKIVLAGGTGFIGRSLRNFLPPKSWDVVVLTRNPGSGPDAAGELEWDGNSVGPWARALDGADAIVNLAGKSINCRFTPRNRAEILASRVNSVRVIGEAIRQCASPPPVWIQAGAVGIYGDAGDRLCDESTDPGTGFFPAICREWEQACFAETSPSTRKAILRIGPVLGANGGALKTLADLTKKGLGGTVGDGNQWLSWIHAGDLSRLIVWAIENSEATGVYNAVAPEPATNRAFMSSLRGALGVRFGLPAPALAVKLGSRFLGVDSSLALEGQRCTPARAIAGGFDFHFPELSAALADLVVG